MPVAYCIVKDQIVALHFGYSESASTEYGPTYTEVMEARDALLTLLTKKIKDLEGSRSKRNLEKVAKMLQRIAELEPIRLYRVLSTLEIDETPDLVQVKDGSYYGGEYAVNLSYIGNSFFRTPQEAVEAAITRMEKYLEERRRDIAVGEGNLLKLKELLK